MEWAVAASCVQLKYAIRFAVKLNALVVIPCTFDTGKIDKKLAEEAPLGLFSYDSREHDKETDAEG